MSELLVTALNTDATEKVFTLYQKVSAHGGGLARKPDEISRDYVSKRLADGTFEDDIAMALQL